MHFSFVLSGVLLLCVVSCAPPQPAEELVFERASARWALLRDGDYEAAWEYHSPGFRQGISAEAYARDAAVRQTAIVDATVVEVACEPESARCEVKTELSYRLLAGPASLRGLKSRRIISERWIYIGQNWWYGSS